MKKKGGKQRNRRVRKKRREEEGEGVKWRNTHAQEETGESNRTRVLSPVGG